MNYFNLNPVSLLFSIMLFSGFTAFGQDSIQRKAPSKDSTVTQNTRTFENAIQKYDKNYYILRRQNRLMGDFPDSVNLQTPQAVLENFIVSARNQKFETAAISLNFNLLPTSTTRKQAKELTRKLYIVVNQNVNINWNELPDRPDGQVDQITKSNKPLAGKARRSIEFGSLKVDGRDISLRLQRLRYKDNAPQWLISANTVENIDLLYDKYGPSEIGRIIPDWGWNTTLFKVPIWKFIGCLVALVISFFLGWLVLFILRKFFSRSKIIWISTISFRLALPAGVGIGLLIFYFLLTSLIYFKGLFANTLSTILVIVIVAAVTWFIMRFLDAFMEYISKHAVNRTDLEENFKSRNKLTHISVIHRILSFVILAIGVAVIFSQFEASANLSTSIFASAGVATIIIGIAAQSTLGNLIAGVQIAITKPVRIGDTVIIEDNWGFVEDIGFVFLTVRTWDKRRLIVPLKSVTTDIFENWSMESSNQIRPITLYVDYKIDVEKIRSKFEKMVRDHEDWDGEKQPIVQVVDVTDKALKINAYCSAETPYITWDLQCELREKLIAYIAELEDGLHLSKSRLTFDSSRSPSEKN